MIYVLILWGFFCIILKSDFGDEILELILKKGRTALNIRPFKGGRCPYLTKRFQISLQPQSSIYVFFGWGLRKIKL